MAKVKYYGFKSPLTAQLELTHACNQNCFFCYNSWRYSNDPYRESSPEEMSLIVDKLLDADIFELVFTGGEPLLRKDLLFELIRKTKERGVIAKINSNIVSFTEEDLQKLRELDADGILASIPGYNSQMYKDIMGKDYFSTATKNLEMLVESGTPTAVNMVVSKRNEGEVYRTGEFLHRQFGLKVFCATPLSPCSKEHQKDELSPEEIERTLADLKRLERDYRLRVDTLEPIPFCILKEPEKYLSLLRRDCSAGRITIAVSPEGNVKPCTHVAKSYGNLLEEPMSDIWGRMVEWRDGSISPDRCEPCAEAVTCSQGCREASRVHFGEYKSPDPWVVDFPVMDSSIRVRNKRKDYTVEGAYYVDPGLKFRQEGKDYVIFSPSTHTTALVNKEFLSSLGILKKKGVFEIARVMQEVSGPKSGKMKEFLRFLEGKRFIRRQEMIV